MENGVLIVNNNEKFSRWQTGKVVVVRDTTGGVFFETCSIYIAKRFLNKFSPPNQTLTVAFQNKQCNSSKLFILHSVANDNEIATL